MILLVVGLVAVIVVVLIAVVLSIRLGRGDDHDEPAARPGSRDRRRDQDERSRERDGRRAPSTASGTVARDGRDSGHGSRGPARERDSRDRDYGGARRPSRPQAPGSRRPVAARSAVGASARGRYGDGPSQRPAAEDYPSMDFAPGGRYPSGDHPSADFPAADYDAMDDPRGGRESRRKPAPAPAGSKTKSRQRGRRDDDSDWPSTEWDKLSDEQYWAELSADKPLASMARPAKAPANGVKSEGSQTKPPAREARTARPAAPERDLPRRTEPARPEPGRTGRGERGEQREPVTERLPVRGAHQAGPAQHRGEADPDAGRPYPGPRPVPGPVPDTGTRAAVRDTGSHGVRESVPRPRAGHRRRDTTGPQPTRDRDQDLAMLTGLASAPPPVPGALEDDPLTSPSFSLKAATSDSRSYGGARKHAKTTGQPGTARASGTGGGSYPAGDYADPGYAYHAAPPATVPPPAPPYGNPYQQAGSGHAQAARYPGGQATGGYASYQTDPLRIYSPPGDQAHAPYAGPASPPGYQQPSAGTAPYDDGYQQHPYPDRAGHQDGSGSGGYASGYEGGYPADPYQAGGYRP